MGEASNVQPEVKAWHFAMPSVRLRVRAACRTRGGLPRYLGTALRGALGHALLETHCRCPGGKDAEQHEAGCLYGSVFEPQPAPDSLFERQRAVAPAFVFLPPLHSGAPWEPGDVLSFDWTLLGPASAQQAALVAALARALDHGLGLTSPRVSFALEQVVSAVPDEDNGTLRLGYTPPAEGTLTLHMESPLHLRKNGRLIDAPVFRDIARAMLARLEAVAGFGLLDGRPHAPALLHLAQMCTTEECRLERVDWSRYSQRQQRRIALNGVIGRIQFRGPVGAFAGLLPLGSAAHLGHGTGWGMGRVACTLEQESD